jgi:hypothetical protein
MGRDHEEVRRVSRLLQNQTGLTIRSALWAGLMLVWLAFLIRGVWWLWPAIERMEMTQDLGAGLLWLILGALAWVLAFNYGRQRYWPHSIHK